MEKNLLKLGDYNLMRVAKVVDFGDRKSVV